MALLWALAAVAAATGAGLLVVQVRTIAGASHELREQLLRLDEVRVAVAHVRSEVGRCADTAHRIRPPR